MHGATSQVLFGVTFLLAFALNRLCVAEKRECIATETREETFYSVPAPKCARYYYSWSNSSDSVLSNGDRKAEDLVNFSNGTFLHTYKCYSVITHFSDCDDKWEKETTTCEIKCPQLAGGHDSHHGGSGNRAGTWRHHVPVPLSLLSVLLAHI